MIKNEDERKKGRQQVWAIVLITSSFFFVLGQPFSYDLLNLLLFLILIVSGVFLEIRANIDFD